MLTFPVRYHNQYYPCSSNQSDTHNLVILMAHGFYIDNVVMCMTESVTVKHKIRAILLKK